MYFRKKLTIFRYILIENVYFLLQNCIMLTEGHFRKLGYYFALIPKDLSFFPLGRLKIGAELVRRASP